MQLPIRVEAPDLRSAFQLIEQAGSAFVTDLHPLPGDTWEVRVAAADVAEVLDLVEAWLERADVPTTSVSVDGHLYTLNRRATAGAAV